MTWCLESSNGRSSDKSPCLMLQRSLSIRWSSPWRNHRWSRTVDGSLKSGEKTSWGRLVVEIPSFTTGFSTIPGGCLGWNWENQWRFDKPTISQFFTDGKAQNSQRTSPFGSSRRPGEAQIMPKTSQRNIPQNPTSYVGNIILQHTSTSKTPWKNVNRFRFHPVSPFTKNCPPKSPWRTRSSAVRSCGKLSRSTEELLVVNNGKSCPGLMTKGPQFEKSLENPKIQGCEGRRYGRWSKCQQNAEGKVIDMGENPLKTLQILPTLVTKDCYLQRQLLPTCHYKYSKSAIS